MPILHFYNLLSACEQVEPLSPSQGLSDSLEKFCSIYWHIRTLKYKDSAIAAASVGCHV